MTPRETVILTRYVKALCPAQTIDEYTPNAWHDVLGAYPLDECRAAVVAAATARPFVAPADIVAEIRRTRRKARDRADSERVLAPARARRQALEDPRPLRSTIRELLASHGLRQLETATADTERNPA